MPKESVEIVDGEERRGTYRCRLAKCPFGMSDLCCFSCESLEICREVCNEIKSGDDKPDVCCSCEIQLELAVTTE